MSKSNAASSNWLALQKKLSNKSTGKKPAQRYESGRKRQKINHFEKNSRISLSTPSSTTAESAELDLTEDMKNGESLLSLKRMVFGEMDYSSELKQPGKYIGIDCEMVGVGIDGSESSLARVTLVNYHGAVQMDEFVRQRERVVDYRTQYSGIRESDMKKAKPFDEIQKKVAELLQDRILVGHAIHNDLKALLLSHPWNFTRDTQYLAGKSKVVRSKYVALRKLVEQELGIVIQAGEHSSLVDARATMAIYRLHRKEWDKGSANTLRASTVIKMAKTESRHNGDDEEEIDVEDSKIDIESSEVERKRKRTAGDEDPDDPNPEKTTDQSPSRSKLKTGLSNSKKKAKSRQEIFPGGGRRGVSSGLSTIVRKGGGGSNTDSDRPKTQWWKELGNAGSSGSKGSLRL
ncbi:ribonuclease H-like domain-containing protein [Lentinula lateritia]|uniref:RNA exonuclease 4 n=1 Tax=Lentinula lateritia TaxID=40482 RepID=A0ABQ8VTU6_9AGAR|nr:ribonuclease H-like domain-containing protein [Lentinula lateritia]